MKKTLNIYLSIFIFLILFARPLISGHPDDQKEFLSQPIPADTVVYAVYGMDCPGCHGALEKQIGKLSCVADVEANWLSQQVSIIVKKDSLLNQTKLYEQIEKANFTPGERIK